MEETDESDNRVIDENNNDPLSSSAFVSNDLDFAEKLERPINYTSPFSSFASSFVGSSSLLIKDNNKDNNNNNKDNNKDNDT
jgi:hypothetical protein